MEDSDVDLEPRALQAADHKTGFLVEYSDVPRLETDRVSTGIRIGRCERDPELHTPRPFQRPRPAHMKFGRSKVARKGGPPFLDAN